MTLEETITRLEAIYTSPCFCSSCVAAKNNAYNALLNISPLADELMKATDRDSDEFKKLEQQFRDDELKRLSIHLADISRSRCEMQPPPEPTPSQIFNQPERMRTYADARMRTYAERIRHVRRIEYLKNPKIPGTYVIK